MTPRHLALFAVAGCVEGAPATTDVPPDLHLATDKHTPVLVTDLCDDAAYADTTWQTASSPHFVLNYLPGTAAEADRDAIAARLETAYADIRSELAIAAEPTLTVNLSPNRNAALEYGLGFGVGWPGGDAYDVIYTGAPDSFEVVRYGNLPSKMLDYYVDDVHRTRVAFLTTGVAEYLDQWHRDLHVAYAKQLLAGTESRVHVADLETRDVSGRNAGRAGSFVQLLVDRYGIEAFLQIYRATAVDWDYGAGCWANASYGCVSTPAQLTALLDGVLHDTVGETWSEVQTMWAAEVQEAFERVPLGMAPSPTSEIEDVVRVMDRAITTHDAELYRSTLEGFYCDYGGETLRRDVSQRAVSAFSTMSSKVLAIYETGIKNFTTAQAIVQRTDERGLPIFSTLYFEHLPVGWRVTWGPDWF